MLKLARALRYKDEIELPTGEILPVNFNAEARAIEYIRAQNALIKISRACEGRALTDEERIGYHRAYLALIRVILGEAATERALIAVEGDREELIGLLDFWIAENIQPLIIEASARIRDRKKSTFLAAKEK